MAQKRIRTKIKKTSHHVFNLKGFRYIISGGSATFVDIGSYFIMYQWVLKKQEVHLSLFTISPHIASFLVSFFLGMVTNFVITKFFVFNHQTNMRKREELLRFVIVSIIVFSGNYILLKFFVETLGIYPTPSRMLSSGIIAVCSFNLHKYFTFKVKHERVKKVS